jgi:replication initiation protein RepC
MVHGIRPNELPRLAPKLNSYLRHPDPARPDIIDAADWLRSDLGVPKSLWGDACLGMGRELAAVAVAIVSTKEPEHFTSTPGGYFHGMVAKAKAGQLNLDRTVWALRRGLDPERQERGRGGAARRRDADLAW